MKKSETREYDTAVVLSMISGRLLCKFDAMHEAIEFVVGSPVWTHQLADRAFVKEIADALTRQHPQLANFDADAMTKENWMPKLAEAVQQFGPTLKIHPMGESEHYRDAVTRPLKGKKVVAV